MCSSSSSPPLSDGHQFNQVHVAITDHYLFQIIFIAPMYNLIHLNLFNAVQANISSTCALISLLLDVGQLQTICHLQYTIMAREYLVCHDKLANIAFCEQSKEFELTQPRSVQTVKFDHFLPISFISQIHILRKGHIGQV